MQPWQVTKRLLAFLFTLTQITVLAAAALLEYYSDKKMGVMRYLVYKNHIFQTTLFKPTNILLFKAFLVTGTAICIILVFCDRARRKSNRTGKGMIHTLAVSVLASALALTLKQEGLNAYYFFLISIFITVIMQYIKLILKLK